MRKNWSFSLLGMWGLGEPLMADRVPTSGRGGLGDLVGGTDHGFLIRGAHYPITSDVEARNPSLLG